jgi:glycolate oxidase
MQRVRESGYIGLAFTVDTAVDSRRERPMLTGWIRPTRRVSFDPVYQAQLTWEEMDEIAAMAGLPVLVKGIATAADAEIALQHGAKSIWVSNHGGRQLDHGLGTMDYLREIVEAVDGRAEVIVDGGIQRGTDVLKAIAYGAKAVAIGRLQVWGLAAAGVLGLLRVLEILEAEIVSAMGLLGVTSIDQLDASYVTECEPVLQAHEMSAFPNLLGGRVF